MTCKELVFELTDIPRQHGFFKEHMVQQLSQCCSWHATTVARGWVWEAGGTTIRQLHLIPNFTLGC